MFLLRLRSPARFSLNLACKILIGIENVSAIGGLGANPQKVLHFQNTDKSQWARMLISRVFFPFFKFANEGIDLVSVPDHFSSQSLVDEIFHPPDRKSVV